MIRTYDEKIRKILSSGFPKTDREKILTDHKEMLSMIRHERLIHLIVTVFVGIVMSMSFFVTILSGKLYTLFLGLPLLMLFVGYIFHYRFLENTTQEWYKLLREIREKL